MAVLQSAYPYSSVYENMMSFEGSGGKSVARKANCARLEHRYEYGALA